MKKEILNSLRTKVHPLNRYLASRVKDEKVLISSRDKNEIKLLTYNIQMLPKAIQEGYASGY